MSDFKPGDKVLFHNHNPLVDDPNEGLVGVIMPWEDDAEKFLTEMLFGEGARTVYFKDSPSEHGPEAVALAHEMTLVE